MPADYVNLLARMFPHIEVSEDLNTQFRNSPGRHDPINIKILNAGATRHSEHVTVSLALELEDYIPDKKHCGRKLQWYHHVRNGTMTFANNFGRYYVDVTTFQMAVPFTWNQRDKISCGNLRLATELICCTRKWEITTMRKSIAIEIQQFILFIFGNLLFFHLNLIGRLQLSTECSIQEDHESVVQLRVLPWQEALIEIIKMRKRINNAISRAELIDILKNIFLPSKKMIKEQLVWLIEQVTTPLDPSFYLIF
uniref:Cullin family profile domain-containing protein n=1 Tax=Glossina austeni TaxID=7395 RepID=A0A1A9UDB2_GLOAU